MQQISLAVDAARNRLTALEDVEAAAKTLYQALTAEQKGIADARIPGMVSPRTAPATGNAPAGGLPEMGSGARQPR